MRIFLCCPISPAKPVLLTFRYLNAVVLSTRLLLQAANPHRSLPPRSVHLINCSRDSYICAESLDAKLGSANLLAVVQSGHALLGEGRREEVIRRLAPSCLRGAAPQLDRASLVSALGLIKVN